MTLAILFLFYLLGCATNFLILNYDIGFNGITKLNTKDYHNMLLHSWNMGYMRYKLYKIEKEKNQRFKYHNMSSLKNTINYFKS